MILVVEDTPVFRKFVCTLLGDAFQVPIREADCGETALPLASAGTVVITDLHMPGMGGLQLIRSLRADRACGGIPIVAMSADADADNAAAALRAGADAFFPKPFDPEEFVGTIGALIAPAATWCPGPRARAEPLFESRGALQQDGVDPTPGSASALAAPLAGPPKERRARGTGARLGQPREQLSSCPGDLPSASLGARATARPASR